MAIAFLVVIQRNVGDRLGSAVFHGAKNAVYSDDVENQMLPRHISSYSTVSATYQRVYKYRLVLFLNASYYRIYYSDGEIFSFRALFKYSLLNISIRQILKTSK